MDAACDASQKSRDDGHYHRLGWLLVVVAWVWLLAPTLLARGMFLDGVIYGAISRNMAVGIGDFWHPRYTEADAEVFHEHPPLAFGLQAILFRICGDHFWVERVYSALCAPCLIAVIALLWRAGFLANSSDGGSGWFPVLLWMAIPSWGWLYKNNVLENTLAPLAALSVYASFRLHQGKNALAWSGLAAAAMLAAGLAKGPVGLFPAIAPLVAGVFLADRNWKIVVRNQAAVLLWFIALAVALCCYEPARQFLSDYFYDQVVSSLAGKRIAQHGRTYLIYRTLTALALPAVIALLIVAWGNRRSVMTGRELAQNRRLALFHLATALSASVPLLASPRQSAMYAAPSYPYYILALAVYCWPAAQALQGRLSPWATRPTNYRVALAALATLLVLAPLASWNRYGVVVRDNDLLSDVATIQSIVPPHSKIAASAELQKDFELEAYLYRSHYVSIMPADDAGALYLASAKGSANANSDRALSSRLELRSYQLYAEAPSGTLLR